MSETRSVIRQYETTGDVAVEGLFSGLIAGLIMALYLILAGLTYGESIIASLSRFATEDGSTPLVGLLLHLGVSGVYGIFYDLGCQFTLRRRANTFSPLWVSVIGGLYGLLLMALAWYILLPSTDSPLLETPVLHLGIAHLLYGVALGLLTYTAARQAKPYDGG
jgi:hypothetical protein